MYRDEGIFHYNKGTLIPYSNQKRQILPQNSHVPTKIFDNPVPLTDHIFISYIEL